MQAYLKTGKTTVADKFTPNTSEKSLSSQKKEKSLTPWVEKYRPKTVEDVVEQGGVVSVLQKCIEGAELPNLLLYGPPGTGKTSTILAAARQLFGDIYKSRILELNASDERGINVVRTKIKDFSQLTASSMKPDGKPCPPFKIIILDEADSMTKQAQAALRRTMEKECRSTRFCLICNYVSRIIEPITSRCTKFRFKSLKEEKIIERLRYISAEEHVSLDENALKAVVEISGGDLRRAITMLQSCYRLKGGETISEDDLLQISGLIPKTYLLKYLEICRSGNYSNLEKFVEDLTYEAYSVGQMLEQFNEFILRHKELTSNQKSIICCKLGECCFRLSEGSSEYLQIMDLGCVIILALKQKE